MTWKPGDLIRKMVNEKERDSSIKGGNWLEPDEADEYMMGLQDLPEEDIVVIDLDPSSFILSMNVETDPPFAPTKDLVLYDRKRGNMYIFSKEQMEALRDALKRM